MAAAQQYLTLAVSADSSESASDTGVAWLVRERAEAARREAMRNHPSNFRPQVSLHAVDREAS